MAKGHNKVNIPGGLMQNNWYLALCGNKSGMQIMVVLIPAQNIQSTIISY